MIGRMRTFAPVACALLLSGLAAGTASGAQEPSTDALRRQVEQRFEVLPLQNGIALRPRGSATGVQSVELSGDTIAVDGAAVTGAELRQKLGADAELVLRLSYLQPQVLRAMFVGRGAPGAPPAPVAGPPPPQAEQPPPQPPPPPAPEPEHRLRRSGARVRFGGSVTVGPNEVVTDSVVVFGGSARIEGEVLGDVVVFGGSITLGPDSHVTRDVVVVGGTLDREPGARVGGRVNEIGSGTLNLDGVRFGRFPWVGGWWWGPSLGGLFTLMSTGTRLLVLCLLACIIVLVAPDPVQRVGARAAAEPVKAGAIGFLAQLLFLPLLLVAVVVLVVTIIGIPLLLLVPFAILGLVLVLLVGFTAVAAHIGHALCERFSWDAGSPFVTTIIGVVAILSPVLLARFIGLAGGLLFPLTAGLLLFGLAVEYAAWTVGFGAVALTRFDRPPAAAAGPPPPPKPPDDLAPRGSA
jgi:hypothetical protein